VHHDAPYPAFKGAVAPVIIDLLEHPDEAILQHIFSLHPVDGVAQAHPHHFGCKLFVQQFLGLALPGFASF